MNKRLIMVRGCPGSGKSTLARKLSSELKGVILSSDDFFTDETGKYNFDINKLGQAHQWNQERTKYCMEMSFPTVIVDNTNTTVSEIFPYLNLAKQYGYDISFKVPDTSWAWNPEELNKKNTHNVPLETIQKMVKRFLHQGNLSDEEFVKKILGEN